jgi:ABC-type lipoprotein release transport system permease subunit
MTFQDQLRTALANVGRRKLRSALASLGVVVGTLTIVIMVSLAAGVRQQINRQFASLGLDRLTVNPPSSRRGVGGPDGFDDPGNASRKQVITGGGLAGYQSSRSSERTGNNALDVF